MWLKATAAYGYPEGHPLSGGGDLFKIWAIVQWVLNCCLYPLKKIWRLAIDEKMLAFKGKMPWRQYLQNKIHKFGLKLFVAVSLSFRDHIL